MGMAAVVKSKMPTSRTEMQFERKGVMQFKMFRRTYKILVRNHRAICTSRRLQFRPEGVFLSVPNPQPIGTEVDLVIEIVEKGALIQIGCVVWRRAVDSSSSLENGMLLRVVECRPEVRRWLTRLEQRAFADAQMRNESRHARRSSIDIRSCAVA